MANTFFKYKQFTVHQEKCAMKVCTDSSFFGGLIEPENPKNILDIGTGTGVLSLMIAQKTNGSITAIEIDENAAIQASENFERSPWSNRLKAVNEDVISFSKHHDEKFDLIISNPPFFQDNMLSEVSEKNKARHSVSLTLKELSTCVNNIISPEGQFWVLLPQHEAQILEELMNANGYYVTNQINIKNYKEDTKISRVVNCFQKTKSKKVELTTSIYENKERDYTEVFINALKPYYLYL